VSYLSIEILCSKTFQFKATSLNNSFVESLSSAAVSNKAVLIDKSIEKRQYFDGLWSGMKSLASLDPEGNNSMKPFWGFDGQARSTSGTLRGISFRAVDYE